MYSGKDMLYSSFDLLQSCNLCFWQDLPVVGKTEQVSATSPDSVRHSATCSYRHPWTYMAFLSSVFWSHRIWLSRSGLRIVSSGTSIQTQNVLSGTVCYWGKQNSSESHDQRYTETRNYRQDDTALSYAWQSLYHCHPCECAVSLSYRISHSVSFNTVIIP